MTNLNDLTKLKFTNKCPAVYAVVLLVRVEPLPDNEFALKLTRAVAVRRTDKNWVSFFTRPDHVAIAYNSLYVSAVRYVCGGGGGDGGRREETAVVDVAS